MRFLNLSALREIIQIAEQSEIYSYAWKDRGVAPSGYTKGMALAYATVLRRYDHADSAVLEMSKANTHNPDADALSWYAGIFNNRGMSNAKHGLDTLRHLFVLLLGLGMRESSGQHCVGRDMSADNVTADTCEAGLFQMSWNMRDCSPEMEKLYEAYSHGGHLANHCILAVFSENVSCDAEDWDCYGDGPGFHYQRLAKACPQFAVETAAIGLRNRRQHWGPINRYEAEIIPAADVMFAAVQDVVVPVA